MRRSRRTPVDVLQPFLLDVPHPRYLRPDSPSLQPAPALDWQALFGNDHAIEIEVGFGKGRFLVSQATARPDVNFLGIEIERKYVLFTADRIARRGLTNVKLACTDARWFLKERVRPSSVAAIHVYFPDPWWKTRHRKRKLFTREFAEACVRALKPGGRLHFVTDVADYFAETLEMLKDVPPLQPASTSPRSDEQMTNFERKYRAEGREIFHAVFGRTH